MDDTKLSAIQLPNYQATVNPIIHSLSLTRAKTKAVEGSIVHQTALILAVNLELTITSFHLWFVIKCALHYTITIHDRPTFWLKTTRLVPRSSRIKLGANGGGGGGGGEGYG